MEKELRSVEALRKLPIGMENFVEIRRNNFYYVDKTRLIEQLVEKWSEVSLFTRPRRFGKTLNMSMLRAFFEVGAEANLFDGLYISHKKELCEQYMGKYPVISFTLKNIEGQSFDEVKKSMKYLIGTIARQYSFLLESEKLSVVDKEIYRALLFTNEDGTFQMSDVALEKSLYRLTELLEKHYQPTQGSKLPQAKSQRPIMHFATDTESTPENRFGMSYESRRLPSFQMRHFA